MGKLADHKENLHGAYLAYTQGDAHENPKPEKGGERRSGEEKKQGRKQRLRSCPLLQRTPVLHCERCPFLWNGEHVLVLLAVDCIGWLFCVSKRRNVTEPRDRWGLYGLWQARDPCAIRRAIRPCPIPCHLTPWPGHRTTTRFKRQPAAPIRAHHSIAKDSDHNAGNGETKQ